MREKSGPIISRTRLIIIILIPLLAITFLFGPSWLLNRWLNRNLEGFFTQVSCEKAQVGLKLNQLSVFNLRLTPFFSPQNPIIIKEIRAEGLSPITLIKMLLGLTETDFPILPPEGEFHLTDFLLQTNETSLLSGLPRNLGPEGLTRLHIGSMNLRGLKLKLSEASPARLVEMDSFQINNLEIRHEAGLALAWAEFSASGLTRGRLESLGIRSLAMAREITNPVNLELGDLTVGSLDLERLLRILATPPDRLNPFDFVSLADSLSLAALALSTEKGNLFIKEAELDQAILPEGKIQQLRRLGGLKMDTSLLMSSNDPRQLILTDTFGPELIVDLNLDSTFDPLANLFKMDKAQITLGGLKTNLDLSLSGSALNSRELPKSASGWLNFLNLSVEPGQLDLDLPDLGKRLFQSLDQRMGLTPEVLSELTALVFMKLEEERSLANLEILRKEIGYFLDDPQSLSLLWNPAPGFPGSIFKKKPPLALLGSSDLLSAIAKSYKYDILQELDLTIAINGRAPVSIAVAQGNPDILPPEESNGTVIEEDLLP